MTTTSRGSSRAQIMPRLQVGGRVVGMSVYFVSDWFEPCTNELLKWMEVGGE